MEPDVTHKHEPSVQKVATIAINTRYSLWVTFLFCATIIVLLFFLDYWINWNEGSSSESIRRMFNTAAEHSIAGWYSTTLTFVVSLAAWANLALARHSEQSVWRHAGWLITALLFTYLSLDDGAEIHEHLGEGLKDAPLYGDLIAAYPSYTWQVVTGPVIAGLGLFMLYFLWKELSHRNDKLGILSAFSCLALALGQDFVEGTINEYDWVQGYGLDPDTVLHFSKSVEESLEMLGMTFFLLVFLSHLMRTFRTVALEFQ